ncbi:lycopene cyclase domain-containing protein [Agromyces seonyuensis]|uniref:Lycopene cyclase domain-containing protein n=1 Tax=Agromyces seonyuensis TaxID=2662446 RepID=A0A6I4P483_9MICO|nr:lycopene cyclase domain-containing protein [Agromyces seonyuensis]
MSFLYLACLLVVIACFALIDVRFRLVVPPHPVAAIATIAIGTVFFVLWDVAGILAGVFGIGDSAYLSGIRLAPEFPLEEIGFLVGLCYLCLLAVAGAERLLALGGRTPRHRAATEPVAQEARR